MVKGVGIALVILALIATFFVLGWQYNNAVDKGDIAATWLARLSLDECQCVVDTWSEHESMLVDLPFVGAARMFR